MLLSTSSSLQQCPTHVTDTRKCPMPCLNQLFLYCSWLGAFPSSQDCPLWLGFQLLALWLSHAAVCTATEHLACWSQDLSDHPTICLFDQRGELVITVDFVIHCYNLFSLSVLLNVQPWLHASLYRKTEVQRMRPSHKGQSQKKGTYTIGNSKEIAVQVWVTSVRLGQGIRHLLVFIT